jgi:hypothetical protein
VTCLVQGPVNLDEVISKVPLMKRPDRFRVIVIVVFGVLFGIAVLSNLNTFLEPRWRTYTAPDGSFSIELPGSPTVETRQLPAEGGATLAMNSVTVHLRSGTTYMCAYSKEVAGRGTRLCTRWNPTEDSGNSD